MGSRGPVGKSPERRQRAGGTVVELVSQPPDAPPDAPAGLLKATEREWEALWQSPLARLVEKTDLPSMERLFLYRDEHRRVLRSLRNTGERLVEGSRGQVRMSPLLEMALKLEASIGRLETELGLTPMARARLGLTVTQAMRSLEDLNRDIEPDDEDLIDPRIIDIDPQEPA